jgi:hypothetical protein
LLFKMAQRDGAATKKGEEKDLTAETQRTQSPSFVLPRTLAGEERGGGECYPKTFARAAKTAKHGSTEFTE